MREAERRAIETELRFVAAEGKTGTLKGYAAVYDSLSLEIGPPSRRFRERIAAGAFRAALDAGNNVFSYYDHGMAGGEPGSTMPLGSTKDGSLRLQEDGRGLAFELDLPDTTDARDLAELVRRGTVRGVSFGFPNRSVRDTWHNDGGTMVRTLHEVRALVDVSPTHRPAYPDTALAVRSLSDWEAADTDRRCRLRLAEIDLS
jgi:uncharacterized protein